MTRATPTSSSATATHVPAESDLLCEGCGYTLNGLPEDGRCPECGKPIAETVESDRQPLAWERASANDGLGMIGAFFLTALASLFRPSRFFRSMTTRGPLSRARWFAWLNWVWCSSALSQIVAEHREIVTGTRTEPAWGFAVLPGAWLLLWLITRYAARLTAWEAAYRGLRLPLNSVLRGMYYHAPHYLPVCLTAYVTTLVFVHLSRLSVVDARHITTYLYILCAEVVLGAAYLFWTYWIAMRNMMFANK